MNQYQKEHHNRPDLTGEHRMGDTGQLIFAVIFFVVWGVDSFVVGWTTFLNDIIPLWLRVPVGILLLVISGFLARSSMKTVFGEVRDPPVVIRTGLYRFSRHPMYFSEILLYSGIFLLSLSIASFVILVGAAVFLTVLCKHEERLLIQRFGDDYLDYMHEVPMWIPGFRRPGKRSV